MGVTVHYRGKLDDIDRVEDFEDRVLDFALAIGASARLWRSVSDQFPDRLVWGLVLDLAPGQEPTSLLISPEGWLVNLMEIEAAENGDLHQPPWCCVKTQYGPVLGHVALIELLRALQQEFITDLKVSDESGFWEHRDIGELASKVQFLASAIDTLSTELDHYALTDEAAEDPDILFTRVERIAGLVQRTMSRPSEHPPVEFDECDDWLWSKGSEAKWDASYREQRRKQERLHRAIEERLAAGDDYSVAFDNAMRDEGFIDLPGEEADELFDDAIFPINDESDQPEFDESWRESLPDETISETADEDDPLPREHHPLQQRALELMSRVHDVAKEVDENASHQLQVLLGGAGDMMGGLAQALSGLDDDDVDDDEFSTDPMHRGLAIVQLKRALRGSAFAFGSLYALAQEGTINDQEFSELQEMVAELSEDILSQLQQFRGEVSE